MWLVWEGCKKTHFKKDHIKSQLGFAKMQLNDSEPKWKNVLWSDETKIKLLSIQNKNSASKEHHDPKHRESDRTVAEGEKGPYVV